MVAIRFEPLILLNRLLLDNEKLVDLNKNRDDGRINFSRALIIFLLISNKLTNIRKKYFFFYKKKKKTKQKYKINNKKREEENEG